MTTNLINRVAYLRTSRMFPNEPDELLIELNKMYIEVAQGVNERTIGLFPTNVPALTGEGWFINENRRQQTFREVYRFGPIAFGATSSLAHKIENISEFTRIYGTCVTDFPDFRPIPYASVAANNNIDLRVDATNIILVNGSGVGTPNITQALVVLEWLAFP